MNGYIIPNDGKIHTHFSELTRCTAGQMHSVLNERAGILKPYKSPSMDFGTKRHDEWRDESLKTGRSPKEFKAQPISFDVKADLVERELASEVLPNIVLHSRMDFYGEGNLIDFKTTTMDRRRAMQTYDKSIQLKIYAYQLMIHNYPVDKITYLIEHWTRDYSKQLGYSKVEKDFLPRYIKEAQGWIKRRCLTLEQGLAIAKEDGIL